MFFLSHHPALLSIPDNAFPFNFLAAGMKKCWLKAAGRQN